MKDSLAAHVLVVMTVLVSAAFAATMSPSPLMAGDKPADLPLYPLKIGLKWTFGGDNKETQYTTEVQSESEERVRSVAAYGNFDYNFTDTWHGSVGARYTSEDVGIVLRDTAVNTTLPQLAVVGQGLSFPLVVMSSQKDHRSFRDRGVGAELPHQFVSVHRRHEDIGDDQIGTLFSRNG